MSESQSYSLEQLKAIVEHPTDAETAEAKERLRKIALGSDLGWPRCSAHDVYTLILHHNDLLLALEEKDAEIKRLQQDKAIVDYIEGELAECTHDPETHETHWKIQQDFGWITGGLRCAIGKVMQKHSAALDEMRSALRFFETSSTPGAA